MPRIRSRLGLLCKLSLSTTPIPRFPLLNRRPPSRQTSKCAPQAPNKDEIMTQSRQPLTATPEVCRRTGLLACRIRQELATAVFHAASFGGDHRAWTRGFHLPARNSHCDPSNRNSDHGQEYNYWSGGV